MPNLNTPDNFVSEAEGECITAINNILDYVNNNFKIFNDAITTAQRFIPKLGQKISQFTSVISQLKQTDVLIIDDSALRQVASTIEKTTKLISSLEERNMAGLREFINLLNNLKDKIHLVIKARTLSNRIGPNASKRKEQQEVDPNQWDSYLIDFKAALGKYHTPGNQNVELEFNNSSFSVTVELLAFISFLRGKQAAKANVFFRNMGKCCNLRYPASIKTLSTLVNDIVSKLQYMEISELPEMERLKAFLTFVAPIISQNTQKVTEPKES